MFFWLKSIVKYKRSALYSKEFANAGIFYHYESVDDNNNYLSYSDLAQKYDLKIENILFLMYVRLYLSISEKRKAIFHSFIYSVLPTTT